MTTRNESDVDPIPIARNGARRGRIRALRGTTIAVEHRPWRWGDHQFGALTVVLCRAQFSDQVSQVRTSTQEQR